MSKTKEPILEIYPIKQQYDPGHVRKPRARYGWRLKAPNGEIMMTGSGGKLRSYGNRRAAWEGFRKSVAYANLGETKLPEWEHVKPPKKTSKAVHLMVLKTKTTLLTVKFL